MYVLCKHQILESLAKNFLQKLQFIIAGNEMLKIPHCGSQCKKMECGTQNTIYAAEKNMIAYLTVDRGYMNSHFLK